MANINFTIPDEKLQRVVDALKGLYPIPVTDDGSGNMIPDFTDNQWAKEAVRRLVVRDVKRWETKIAQLAANQPADDDIIT